MVVKKDMTFADLLDKHPESVEVLMESGMHCIGCPAAMFETQEQGAMAHGIDVNELVEKINKKIGGKEKKVGLKEKKVSENEINKKWEKMKNN